MARFLLALVLIIAAIAGLLWLGGRGATPATQPQPGASAEPLALFCAAGVRKPAEACAVAFAADQGLATRFQFGGSGQLLASIGGGAPCDLFLAGDASFIRIGREKGLLREAIQLAIQQAVVAVPAGNPKGIATLDDLLKPGVRFALPNPESASLGKAVQREFQKAGRWEAVQAAAAVMKPTVTDLISDLQVGAVDATLLWDANVRQLGLVAITLPELAQAREEVTVAVTTASKRPTEALRLARWMASPEHGNPVWQGEGYQPIRGDAWAVRPGLRLFSGSVNRLGVEQTLREFSEREGCEITTVFNGCGILCAQMKQDTEAGGHGLPDAYYACDICFVAPVADRFPEAVILTEADIVIAVPKDNPHGIKGLADLAKPGLKVGIGNHLQSTLGYMTDRMLATSGLKESVGRNVASQVPTGDLLVNQLRTGSLDAAIVYQINAQPQAQHLATIRIQHAGAKAMQPFAVAKDSPRAQLGFRLLDALRAQRGRFEEAGFRWRGDAPAMPSSAFPSDPADANRPQ